LLPGIQQPARQIAASSLGSLLLFRFAQEALGHNSKALYRACAKRALMKIPLLDDNEQVVETVRS
jgi:hypothetical protein